jgi:lysophospholipase L1-like esterase
MRRFVRQSAKMLSLACALILVLEVFLRLTSFAWYHSPYYLLYGIHNGVETVGINPWSWFQRKYYKFPPNYISNEAKDAAEQQSVTWTINSRGFRGPDFEVAKPKGVFRIVCLGESNTFGYHDRDDETYPYILGRLFAREKLPVEVINAGFPYYNSGDILSLLKKEIVNYKPDLLTFYEAYGDASWPIEIGPLGRAALWLHNHSITDLLLRNNFKALGEDTGRVLNKLVPQSLPREQLRKNVELVAERYRENVRSIVHIAKSRGIPIILIRQPLTARNPNYGSLTYEQENQSVRDKFQKVDILTYLIEVWMLKQHRLMEELDKIAKEEKLPVVDYIKIVDQDRSFLASWVHLSGEGKLRLAEALESVIKPYVLRALGRSNARSAQANSLRLGQIDGAMSFLRPSKAFAAPQPVSLDIGHH